MADVLLLEAGAGRLLLEGGTDDVVLEAPTFASMTFRSRWKVGALTSPPANGSVIINWNDISGNGYTGLSGLSNAPIYRTTGAFLPNGKAVAEALGNSDPKGFDTTAANNTATTKYVVCRFNTFAVENRLLGSVGGYQLHVGDDLKPGVAIASVVFLEPSSGAATTLSTNTWYVLTLSANGSNSATIYVNGAFYSASTTAHTPAAGDVLQIFHAGGGNFLNGYIAEVLDAPVVHTAAERAVVHTYLQTEYGITMADAAAPTTTVSTSYASTWNVRGAVAKTSASTWNTRSRLTKTSASTWNVLGVANFADLVTRGRWRASTISSPPADAGLLQTWTDTSGNGSHATQATSARRPIYRSSGSFLPNGKPVVEFSTTSLQWLDATTPNKGATTRYIVFRAKTFGSDQAMVSRDGGYEVYTDAGGAVWMDIPNVASLNVAPTPTPATGTWYVCTVDSNGSNLHHSFMNGTAYGTSSVTAVAVADVMSIGGRGWDAGVNGWDGYIAEILDYPVVHNASQRAAVHSYIQTEYGITVADYVAPATTSVSSTSASTWKVRAAVAKTSAATWNVRTAVVDSESSTWAVRARVNDSESSTWNVRATVTDTESTTWNVRTPVAKTSASTWAIRTSLSAALGSTWATRSSAAATFASLWGLRASVVATSGSTWNTRTPVTATSSSTWAVRTAVSKTSAATWNVRAGLATTSGSTWAIRTTATASSASTWNVRTTVTATHASSWQVKTSAAQTFAGTWTVRAAVLLTVASTWQTRGSPVATYATTWAVNAKTLQTLAVIWHTRAAIVKTSAATWNVRTTIAATSANTWAVRTSTATTSGSTWAVRARAAATSANTWHVRAFTVATYATTWDVEQNGSVAASYQTGWNVRATIASTSAFNWAIRTSTSTSVGSTWNTKVRVSTSVGQLWRTLVQVNRVSASTWAIRTNVGQTYVSTWNVRAAAVKSSASTWNVRSLIAKTSASTWAVRAAVAVSAGSTWNVRALVGQTWPQEWDTLSVSGVSASYSSTWNVRTNVTRTAASSWSVKVRISTTSASTWAVRTQAVKTVATAWNVGGRPVAQYASTWQVRETITTTRASTWKVRTVVVYTSSQAWKVRVSVDRQASFLWAARQQISVEADTTWNVLGRTNRPAGWTWNVAAPTAGIVAAWSWNWAARALVELWWTTDWSVFVDAPPLPPVITPPSPRIRGRLGGPGTMRLPGDPGYRADTRLILGRPGAMRLPGDPGYRRETVTVLHREPTISTSPALVLNDDPQPVEETVGNTDRLLINFTIRARSRTGYDDDGNVEYSWSDLVTGIALKMEKTEETNPVTGQTYVKGHLLLSNPDNVVIPESAVAVDSNGEMWRIMSVQDLPDSSRLTMESLRHG